MEDFTGARYQEPNVRGMSIYDGASHPLHHVDVDFAEIHMTKKKLAHDIIVVKYSNRRQGHPNKPVSNPWYNSYSWVGASGDVQAIVFAKFGSKY